MARSPEQQKSRILDAAAGIFAAAGFAGARVDKIAAAAGVNKRLLYHYVGAKAELLQAVLAREALRVTAASVSEPGVWRLVLEEAAHASSPQLLPALAAQLSADDGAATHEGLAQAMFRALLPEFVVLEPLAPGTASRQSAGLTTTAAVGVSQKPRVRMQPQLIRTQASVRSDSNRSK